MEDLSSVSGLGRSSGEGKGYPLQYSSLENSMDHKDLDMTEQLSLLSEVTVFFPFLLCIWKHVSKFSPHSEGEGDYALPSGRQISINYLNSSVGEIISSLPLIFLKNIYSIFIWLHGVLSCGTQDL